MKYPQLSPPHGTSLGTTAGITAVITLVAAASVLSQCHDLAGRPLTVAILSVACLILGAGGLYDSRNQIGLALDLAAAPDPVLAGVAAARGHLRFHLAMALVFAGTGLAAAFRLAMPQGGAAWALPALGALLALASLGNAMGWYREAVARQVPAGRAAA